MVICLVSEWRTRQSVSERPAQALRPVPIYAYRTDMDDSPSAVYVELMTGANVF